MICKTVKAYLENYVHINNYSFRNKMIVAV